MIPATERDRAIISAINAGESRAEVAKRHNLSAERIGQIVRTARGPGGFIDRLAARNAAEDAAPPPPQGDELARLRAVAAGRLAELEKMPALAPTEELVKLARLLADTEDAGAAQVPDDDEKNGYDLGRVPT